MIKVKTRGDYTDAYGGRTRQANLARMTNRTATGIAVSTNDSRPATATAGAIPPNRPPINPNAVSGHFGSDPDKYRYPQDVRIPGLGGAGTEGQYSMSGESYPTSKRTAGRWYQP